MEDSSEMRTVLVTGATGFIGFEVARELNRRGLRPRLMVRRKERARLLAPLDADVVFGDLDTPASLARAVRGCDTVIHLAARATFESYARLRPTIVDGTANLARAAREAGAKRFIYASSLLVYGSSEEAINEESKPDPQIGYGRAKIEAEALLRREIPEHMDLAIVRLPHVYGARSFFFEQLRRFVIPFPGSGRNVLSHLHVRDAARLLVEIGARGWTGTSPVADDSPCTWNEFFSVLEQHYPRMRLLKLPSRAAVLGSMLLEGLLSLRRSPTLYTSDTVRGWLLNLPVQPGLIWKDLGISPTYTSVDTGIPASLDEAVSFRWLHSLMDGDRA